MYIEKELCQKCLDCRPVCPMGAIMVKNKEVLVDYVRTAWNAVFAGE